MLILKIISNENTEHIQRVREHLTNSIFPCGGWLVNINSFFPIGLNKYVAQCFTRVYSVYKVYIHYIYKIKEEGFACK